VITASAVAAGGECAGVAVGEHTALGQDRRAMLSDGGTEPAILLMDAPSLGQRCGCERGSRGVLRQPREHADRPFHRPAKVDGGRTGAGKQFRAGQHMGPRLFRRQPVTDSLACRHGQAVGTRDADRGCAANP
jgi:hypothetical protein